MAPSAWQRIKTASVRGFHAYANWLVLASFVKVDMSQVPMSRLVTLPMARIAARTPSEP